MKPIEAFALVGFILVGYPRERPWSDETMQLWADELAEVGPTEGKAAARQMFHDSDFPTLRAFNAALAVVRERHHAIQASPNFERRALAAVPDTPGDVARARAEIAEFKTRWRAKSTRALAGDRARRVPLRVDERYFHPPEPEPPSTEEDP